MSRPALAYVAGAWEHPLRYAPDKSVAQLHAECARGALADAGLSISDVDGYFCAGDAGLGPAYMVDYLNLKLRHVDGTEIGGGSYLAQIGHAANAIAARKCSVALITLAGRPRSNRQATGTEPRVPGPDRPSAPWDADYRWTIGTMYGNFARRHMYEYGTTSEQLAWVKVAASHHAQHNPHALLRKVFTVEDVLGSPMVADPLHRLDCCVITDGGGALVVVAPEVARSLNRPRIKVIGHGETIRTNNGGHHQDMLATGAARSAPMAFAQAGVTPADIKYASIYDNFTIMVIMQLEDLGFCPKGEGGRFVADGNLISGVGKLPFNTDGGGLCNNHPANRGGMTKAIEAVRQLRGEAHPAVQVKNCDLALAAGPGGVYGVGHSHTTVIFEREH
ncbi:acetyl-CoA acetyltransferase [Alicycliphilus denitrificans]|uniref:thiolase domain-containing protein n=1 Tax=Alicycliphilus denitrificans TaxID=179636 RepID=UPI00095A4C8C|nr:thiolase domain-containing protein [Alicycliphilus denitrificans]MBN9575247.1 thiolase domain-containing protein [Alicycliphilus denitrificans]OJW85107.1 MAG: acetyl-CoA acetyltransferase [Alicycliphilus sp. 69-12]BCN40939.1 acetyl-CoA acetyltransferase [Alicycliphilus denitrificans]